MNHVEHAEQLNPIMDRLWHALAVPIAGVGVVAPNVENHVEVAKQIMASPLSSYASVASAIYLTLMIVKTVYELYVKWKEKK